MRDPRYKHEHLVLDSRKIEQRLGEEEDESDKHL